jgi:hypothetical protein
MMELATVAGMLTGCGGDDGVAPATSGAGSTGGRADTSGGGGNAGGPGGGAAGSGGTSQGTGGGGAGGAEAGTDDTADPDAGAGGAITEAGSGGNDAAAGAAGWGGMKPEGSVVWAIDNVQSIAGYKTTAVGTPMAIDAPAGKAVQFDGVGDALFVENHPLAGLSKFTAEIIFRPDSGGATAQRFFHMSENGSGSRVLFETRLPGDGKWVLDVFVESKGGNVALYAPQFLHPLDAWYNVAAVVDGARATSYVDGQEEMSVNLTFQPHMQGQTSIGVRINKMYFFKGAIRLARFTPRALLPAEFLRAN